MQYLPGLTVQCINPLCAARGRWLRADTAGPVANDGRCPSSGDFLRRKGSGRRWRPDQRYPRAASGRGPRTAD